MLHTLQWEVTVRRFHAFQAVDWWSLGVLMYELLTGGSPFTVDGDENSHTDIAKYEFSLIIGLSLQLYFSYNQSIMLWVISLAHHRRIAKKDPPFPKDMGPLAKDLIQRLLIKDPKKRLGSGPNGAENVKKHPFYQVDFIACLIMFTIFNITNGLRCHCFVLSISTCFSFYSH